MTLRRPGQRAGAEHAERPRPGHGRPEETRPEPSRPGETQPGETHGQPRPEPPQPFERYWPRTGTEPVTARSAMGLRLFLAALFTPVFLAGTALLWFWTTQTGPGDVPTADSLRTLTVICAGLSLFALTDLVVVLRRRSRRRPPPSR